MKQCTKCNKDKNENEFYADKRHKNCLYSWCKLCHNNITKRWYKNNLEKHKELMNIWYKEN
mgnify:CR=1 FL=1